VAATFSKGEVNRAGQQLRDWWMNPNSRPIMIGAKDPLTEALGLVLFEFRPTFQKPLDKVVMGVRSMVKSASPSLKGKRKRLPVGQRLKRELQIIDKLARHPKMQLARMQDIGGCRAVLPGGQDEVYAVVDRMKQADWDVRGFDDYSKSPTKHGYRAVHAIVMRDDRLIEIQLRTPGQNQWAIAVERASIQLRMPLKFGVGEPKILEYFARAADAIALQETGTALSIEFTEAFEKLQTEVRPLFARPVD
jgi:putative GTP pyrophosphokinase